MNFFGRDALQIVELAYYKPTVARNGQNVEVGVCVADSYSRSIIDL